MEKIEGFQIINIWLNKTPELAKKIIDFWMSEKALPSIEAAQKRIEEVALMARDNNGNIIAVGSIYEKFNSQLENFFYYYRTFVGKNARSSKIARLMLITMRDFLEENYIKRKRTKSIGVIIEIENKMLQNNHNEAIWPETKFVYIGKNERGDHVRVYYFKDARIS